MLRGVRATAAALDRIFIDNSVRAPETDVIISAVKRIEMSFWLT